MTQVAQRSVTNMANSLANTGRSVLNHKIISLVGMTVATHLWLYSTSPEYRTAFKGYLGIENQEDEIENSLI